MSVHLIKEIGSLKKRTLQLTAIVEENVGKAVHSVTTKDSALAAEVIRRDDEIDRIEVELEEECLKILALHQPVAADLRYVITCLKINNDLERIGDLAVNIAERAMRIAEEKEEYIPVDFTVLIEKTRKMLNMSLDSFIGMNTKIAIDVCQMDDELDALNHEIHREIRKVIKKKTKKLSYHLNILGVSRQLERIGDYATNIAEDVLYMIDGKIVRHNPKLRQPQDADDEDES